MTTSSERRLHPLSVLFDAGRVIPSMLLPLVALLFTERDALFYVLIPAAVLSVLVIAASIVRYLRFTYRYDERDLVIRSGLFTRNERSIPYSRIQNLDAAQTPLQRILGVTVVIVQTGGGAEPEATLRVLPRAALEEMRARVLGTDAAVDTLPDPDGEMAAAEPAPAPRERRTLLTLSPRDLIVAGFIENRGMVVIIGAIALLEQAGVTERVIERVVRTENVALFDVGAQWLQGGDVPLVAGAVYITLALLGMLLFIRLLSTVWAVVRLYGFRLSRAGDDLYTEYGLFTRVNATIPLRRVQTVIVREGWLHRLLGRRRVEVVTAGGLVMDKGMPAREPIAPILDHARLPALLHEIHPGLDIDDVAWRPVHPRAFGRMLRGSLAWPILLALPVLLLSREAAIVVFALLATTAIVHSYLRARHVGWAITGDAIIVRDGALTRSTRAARFNRVQVTALDRNPFDIRTGMSNVRADTAGYGGGVVVPFLPERAAAELHAELSARAAETAFTW